MRIGPRIAVGCLAFVSSCSTEVSSQGKETYPTAPAVSEVGQEQYIPTFTSVAISEQTTSPMVADATEEALRLDPPTTSSTLPPTTPPTVLQLAGRICTQEQADGFAHQLLDRYGIPTPTITFEEESSYPVGSSRVEIEVCETESVVAHEIGHYVHSRSVGFSYPAMVQDAKEKFSGGWWIKGKEHSPGIEYAAHCVGNVLYGDGPYTKCPSAELRQLAREVINQA